jgi:predicted nucleotidyltransferase
VKEWSGRGVDMDNSSDSKVMIQSMVQVNLVDALLHANTWKLSDESMKQLKQSCLTQRCLQYFPKQ